jgi:hypothetical protein
MPTRDTRNLLIARFGSNASAAACEVFPALNSTMRKPRLRPRVGRHAHIAAERAALVRAKPLTSQFATCFASNGLMAQSLRWKTPLTTAQSVRKFFGRAVF